MTISIGLLGAAVWFLIRGNWNMGLFVLAVDLVVSWIGGYIMMQNDKRK